MAPLPSPDWFSPCSSLDTTPGPVSRSPMRDSPIVRDDVEQDDHWAEDDHEYAEGSNPLEQPVPEQASGKGESHDRVKIVSKPTNTHITRIRREDPEQIKYSCPERSNQ